MLPHELDRQKMHVDRGRVLILNTGTHDADVSEPTPTYLDLYPEDKFIQHNVENLCHEVYIVPSQS